MDIFQVVLICVGFKAKLTHFSKNPSGFFADEIYLLNLALKKAGY